MADFQIYMRESAEGKEFYAVRDGLEYAVFTFFKDKKSIRVDTVDVFVLSEPIIVYHKRKGEDWEQLKWHQKKALKNGDIIKFGFRDIGFHTLENYKNNE